MTIIARVKGGPGSGNWGHRGRPGLVGGSGGRGGGVVKMPRAKYTGTSGEVLQRARERADVMSQRHPGVKFSLNVSNPLGVAEARKLKIPGAGLPQAIFDDKVEPITDPDVVEKVIQSARHWGKIQGGGSGYCSYNAIQGDTKLKFQTIFGVLNHVRSVDPYTVKFTVNRMGDNVYVAVE